MPEGGTRVARVVLVMACGMGVVSTVLQGRLRPTVVRRACGIPARAPPCVRGCDDWVSVCSCALGWGHLPALWAQPGEGLASLPGLPDFSSCLSSPSDPQTSLPSFPPRLGICSGHAALRFLLRPTLCCTLRSDCTPGQGSSVP